MQFNHSGDYFEGRFVELRCNRNKIPTTPFRTSEFQIRRVNVYLQSHDPIINKMLLFFSPQIPETEGASLAASHGVGFCEVSVAENSPNLYKVFEKLLVESRARPVKPRKFSVSKMIGKFN